MPHELQQQEENTLCVQSEAAALGPLIWRTGHNSDNQMECWVTTGANLFFIKRPVLA